VYRWEQPFDITFFMMSPADSGIWFLVPSKLLHEFADESLFSVNGDDEVVGT
jgi:hypothetical protein